MGKVLVMLAEGKVYDQNILMIKIYESHILSRTRSEIRNKKVERRCFQFK